MDKITNNIVNNIPKNALGKIEIDKVKQLVN